ncbi:MAG: GIY-YIG nuclease family protein [Prevotella sp.]|jgi:hypothetical protein|nr:GIY-YIG nuclease family protein [Prevotella sp.]
MARGKSINLFLMDGNANGMIKCTLANWIGIAYKIPRTSLDKCKNRTDLKQTGVYFLFGVSDTTGKSVVYVGQAGNRKNGEGILNRLLEHKRNPKEDYWTEAVVFTTSNNSFGPTEISYLENRFCNLAVDAKRYEVKNGNDPSLGNITEEKESELEDFIEYAELMMGTLGHKVFIPYTSPAATAVAAPDTCSALDNDEPEMYLSRAIKKSSITVKATGRQTSEGFVVLKGSIISPDDDNTIPPGVKKLRQASQIDSDHVLQEDVLLGSPSSAAMFVIGKSSNGWTAWKTSDGKTLHDLENA